MILLLFLLFLVGQWKTEAKKPECLEPAYEGRYLSLHVFWSYSPTLGECVQKTFGGPSPPGRNHFDSLEDCKETCVD
uniref:Kunitz-type serine protease inhibitor conotoxin Cal9.1b-like n=1 Tax=Crassostrea virginica TaxID=6565 RepID=A0A8B8AGP0_CRAVI|nr:kunitz-type serine protease inhibitor conotoxin Cal9.1b-like [Crassostrea virginica]